MTRPDKSPAPTTSDGADSFFHLSRHPVLIRRTPSPQGASQAKTVHPPGWAVGERQQLRGVSGLGGDQGEAAAVECPDTLAPEPLTVD